MLTSWRNILYIPIFLTYGFAVGVVTDQNDHATIVKPVLTGKEKLFPLRREARYAHYFHIAGMKMTSGVYNELYRNISGQSETIFESLFWERARETGKPAVYYIADIPDRQFRNLIGKAISEWTDHTCIDFIPVTRTNAKHKVIFKKHRYSCSADFGKTTGLSQEILLRKSCLTKENIVRYIGLTLGLNFEFFRPDRDTYITVNEENLRIDRNDLIKSVSNVSISRGLLYDYASVMHLGGLAFSKNGHITLATKDVKYQGILGRSHGHLSHRDKVRVNTHYNCLEPWLAQCGQMFNPCQHEGYIGHNCSCICRKGAIGANCEHLLEDDFYGLNMQPCSREISQETTIETPGYPNRVDTDTWCVFKLFAPRNHVIIVKFITFHLQITKSTCEDAFLEIRNKGYTFGKVYCDEDIKPDQEIMSAEDEMSLYVDVRNDQSKGFKAEVTFHSETSKIVMKKRGNGTDRNTSVANLHLVVFALAFLWTHKRCLKV